MTRKITKRAVVGLLTTGIGVTAGVLGLADGVLPAWLGLTLVAIGVVAGVYSRQLVAASWHLRKGHDAGFTLAASVDEPPLVYLRSRRSLVHSERATRLPRVKVAYRSGRGTHTYRLNVAENPGGDRALGHDSWQVYQSDDAEIIVLVRNDRPDYIGRKTTLDVEKINESARTILAGLTAEE